MDPCFNLPLLSSMCNPFYFLVHSRAPSRGVERFSGNASGNSSGDCGFPARACPLNESCQQKCRKTGKLQFHNINHALSVVRVCLVAVNVSSRYWRLEMLRRESRSSKNGVGSSERLNTISFESIECANRRLHRIMSVSDHRFTSRARCADNAEPSA